MEKDALDFIARHRLAHLATADKDGQPLVVPICYAIDGQTIYSAIDQKPKAVSAPRLARLRNIEVNPRVSFVVDDYSEEWDELAYVLVKGRASVIWPAGEKPEEHMRAVTMLREKYSQYTRMAIETGPIIKIEPVRTKMWSFQPSREKR